MLRSALVALMLVGTTLAAPAIPAFADPVTQCLPLTVDGNQVCQTVDIPTQTVYSAIDTATGLVGQGVSLVGGLAGQVVFLVHQTAGTLVKSCDFGWPPRPNEIAVVGPWGGNTLNTGCTLVGASIGVDPQAPVTASPTGGTALVSQVVHIPLVCETLNGTCVGGFDQTVLVDPAVGTSAYVHTCVMVRGQQYSSDCFVVF
jgi:hypothetical protein